MLAYWVHSRLEATKQKPPECAARYESMSSFLLRESSAKKAPTPKAASAAAPRTTVTGTRPFGSRGASSCGGGGAAGGGPGSRGRVAVAVSPLLAPPCCRRVFAPH